VIELADDEHDAALAALPAAERDGAAALSPTRRRDFIRGRTALHALVGDAAITPSDRGAPHVDGFTCSISHKGTRAAAIAAPDGDGFVGVDLERAEPPRIDISSKVLTAREPRAAGAELTRVFALKEAIYKAIDPIVRRYVAFTEVEIEADGRVTSALPIEIEAWSIEHDGHWLATARARRQ
jgi:4'-phosphopantetheinyl transferase EntD